MLSESRTKKQTGERRGRPKFGHREEGRQSLRHWRTVLRPDTRRVSHQRHPPVRRSNHQRLGEHPWKRHGVTNFERSEECCRIAISQRSQRTNHRVPACTQPPVSFLSGSATSFVNNNQDPWDIHRAYPTSFCSMTSNAETTAEEVSIGHPSKPFVSAPPHTWSWSCS